MLFQILFVFLIVYFLIFIHEFGHYLAAIRNGVKVEEFSIGFPPRLISFKKGDTKFSFALLPLGGYVKLHGDSMEQTGTDKIVKSKSFVHKTPWQKIKILLAGVFMNFLVYLILMTSAFSFGVPKMIQSYEALISEINAGQISVEQGLKISSINDSSKASEIFNENSLIEFSNGKYLIGDLEFESLADLNEYGINLNNFIQLPALKVLDSGSLFEKDTHLIKVNGKFFSSYDEFLNLLQQKAENTFITVYTGSEVDVQLNSYSDSFFIVDVVKDSSAYTAGVQTGFKLLNIDGVRVSSIENLSSFVKNLDKSSILYTFENLNKEVINLEITPDSQGITGMVLNPIYNSFDLGSSFVMDTLVYSITDTKDFKLGFLEAFSKSLMDGISMSGSIMKSFVTTILNFFTSLEVSEDVGGPVAVFKMSYDYVAIGGTQLMQFVALISLTLAAINLIPIPVLDGGRIFIVLCEAIIGKAVSTRFVNLLTLVSFAILMFFILIITFFDIIRL